MYGLEGSVSFWSAEGGDGDRDGGGLVVEVCVAAVLVPVLCRGCGMVLLVLI